MTFAAFETNTELAQPVELYEFAMGGEFHRFTSNDVDVTYLASVYTAIPIQRANIKKTLDAQQDNLAITMPSNLALVQQFILNAPGKNAVLTCRRFHRNDPDLQSIVLYKGLIHGVAFSQKGRVAELQIRPLASALNRTIPRLVFSNLCGHMLYDGRCKIVEAAPENQKLLTVTATSGNTITCTGASSFGADFFEAGFVTFSGDYRLVVKQTGDVLELLLPFSNSPMGQTVKCNKGCKHRITADCLNRFNNVPNYGGFPYIAKKNPFATGLD